MYCVELRLNQFYTAKYIIPRPTNMSDVMINDNTVVEEVESLPSALFDPALFSTEKAANGISGDLTPRSTLQFISSLSHPEGVDNFLRYIEEAQDSNIAVINFTSPADIYYPGYPGDNKRCGNRFFMTFSFNNQNYGLTIVVAQYGQYIGYSVVTITGPNFGTVSEGSVAANNSYPYKILQERAIGGQLVRPFNEVCNFISKYVKQDRMQEQSNLES